MKWATIVFLLAGPLALPLQGQWINRRMMIQPAGPGTVGLPYSIMTDPSGGNWMVYGGGWFQVQGNQPIVSQGAMLSINGAQAGGRMNQARLDEKTGELVLEEMSLGGFSLTRRISANREEGYVRYLDIIKNPQHQEATASVLIQTNLNYGIQTAQMIADSRKKEQNLAWVAQTPVGASAVGIFAGKGAKMAPTLNWPQGSNNLTAQIQLKIPPGKEMALLHLHSCTGGMDAGSRFAQSIKESKLLLSIPGDLRRLIVNFPSGQNFIGDYEILRGDLFDVLELRNGDQIKGTIQDSSYKLSTFYGSVELPAQQVIGLINLGEFRPRQLIVLADGQILGGHLEKPTIQLQLSSGQQLQVPVAQLTRMGYRKRPGEAEEWAFDKPLLLTRNGDRVLVQMPTVPIPLSTRYGPLQLSPQAIDAIAFQVEEHGVHEVYLTDGSRFAAVVGADRFDLKLANLGSQAVQFPASGITRLQLSGKAQAADDSAPTLRLANDDVLVGTFQGQLKLDTAFDTLLIAGTEIKRLTHAKNAGLDVQITLWDDTAVSGQLQQQDLDYLLQCGVTLKVPLALVDQYDQPLPQPSAAMVEKIKAIVADLNADDWKQRDQAESQLVSMGPVVAGVLKQLRLSQAPEAQQRIDSILKQLEKAGEKSRSGASSAAPVSPASD